MKSEKKNKTPETESLETLSSAEMEALKRFVSICEKWNLQGLDFQHAALCDTRAWLHLRRIQTAMLDEGARMGSALHMEREGRDPSVSGLLGIKPDSADWSGRVVTERKGRFSEDEGSLAQTEFYGWALSMASGKRWRAIQRGIIDKKSRELDLDGDSLRRMLSLAEKLDGLAREDCPPLPEKKGLCPKCSFRWLCWDDAD